MIFSWKRSASKRTQRCVASERTGCNCNCNFFMKPTFGDLPVVAETPAQGHGDGREVGHVVAVAVHAAVPPGADRLRGQAGAVEARVRDAPPCSAAAVAARRKEKKKEGFMDRFDVTVFHKSSTLCNHEPLGEIKGRHFGLQLCDVIQVDPVRAKMAASLFCTQTESVVKLGCVTAVTASNISHGSKTGMLVVSNGI